MFGGQPRQIVLDTPSQPIAECHGCHPKLHRRLTLGGSWFQASLGKKFSRLHLNGKRLDVVAGACHPSYSKKLNIGGSWSRPAWAKVRPYLQNNQCEKC
jgi:hypothetical protein